MLQWRNTELDFSSIAALAASLDSLPKVQGLARAPIAEDQIALEFAARDEKVVRAAKTQSRYHPPLGMLPNPRLS